MKTIICQLLIISLLICLTNKIHGQDTDSTGYMLLLQNRSLRIEVREGDRIRLKTGSQRDFGQFYTVKRITEHEIAYGTDMRVLPDQIESIMKKKEVSASVIGTILFVAGIAILENFIRNIDPFGNDGQLLQFFSGVAVSAIGISILVPPVFSKRKNSKIQIERVYRH